MNSTTKTAPARKRACKCPKKNPKQPSLEPAEFKADDFCLNHFDTVAASKQLKELSPRAIQAQIITPAYAVALAMAHLNPEGREAEEVRTAGRRFIQLRANDQDIRDINPLALEDDIKQITEGVVAQRKKSERRRVDATTGGGARENYLSGIRRIYKTTKPYTNLDGGPALHVKKKGRKNKDGREAYSASQLRQIWAVGKRHYDPDLALTILDIIRMTGVRRMSVAGLNMEDIEWTTGRTTVRGKNKTVYTVRLSHRTMESILQLWLARSEKTENDLPKLMEHWTRQEYDRTIGDGGTPALLRKGGQPITDSSLAYLMERIQKQMPPGILRNPFCFHSLRHTLAQQINQNYDKAAASGFAGHRHKDTEHANATGDYVLTREQVNIEIFNQLFGPEHITGPMRVYSGDIADTFEFEDSNSDSLADGHDGKNTAL